MPKAKSARERMFEMLDEQVREKWGDPDKLGVTLYRALLAEWLLVLSTLQDESVPDSTVREILNEGWAWIIDKTEGAA